MTAAGSLLDPAPDTAERGDGGPGAGLVARNLTARLDGPEGRFLLRIDSFTTGPGEVMALTGESGSGKTLVLELLGLMRAPRDAAAHYTWTPAGQGKPASLDLAQLWSAGPRSAELARTRGRLFGFVPQTGGLLPYLTVRENIALQQRLAGCPDADLADTLMEQLDLRAHAAVMPGQLSVGQRQRVAVARALAHRPAVVIADEPTASLDPENSDRVLRMLLDAARITNAAVLVSSHEIDRLDRFGVPRCALRVSRDGNDTVSTLDTQGTGDRA